MLISKPKSYNNWSTDLDNAAKYVAQITSSLDITHHISSIENTQDGILAMFDQFSGIDWIGKTPENNLYGVAVRVQWVNDSKAWNSFTVRSKRHTGTKTEYEKRIQSIKEGFFYPMFTIQAYIDRKSDKIVSVALVKTVDLYEYMDKYSYEVTSNKSDNEFKVVWWNKYKEHYNIKIKDYSL
jgi:hypothetical protein